MLAKVSVMLSLGVLTAQNFTPPAGGCWMSHCDPQLDDATGIALQPGTLAEVYHDTGPGGTASGLGCSGNGSVFACAYVSQVRRSGPFPPPFLKVYDLNGDVLWSTDILDGALGCAPMVGADGGVVSCDDTQIVRWDQDGNVLWDSCFYAGTAPACTCPDGLTLPPCSVSVGENNATSPVLLANGSIVVATYGTSGHGGRVFNVNSSTGAIISSLYLDQSGSDSYITTNTPCVSAASGPDGGNRVFIITQYSAAASQGRMYALTVGESAMNVAWVYPSSGYFTGPSGASPLCVAEAASGAGGVYTDARNSANPSYGGALWGFNQTTGEVLFACDGGTAGTGCTPPATYLQANFAEDPRGGFWEWCVHCGEFDRRSLANGELLQRAPVQEIVPGELCPQSPNAAVTMSTDTAGNPVLISGLAARASCGGGAYVVAIDAVTGGLLSSFQIEPDVRATSPGVTNGQFPLATTGGQTRIAFPTNHSGMFIIGTE